MQIERVVVARKEGKRWEGALIINGKFTRAFVESDLTSIGVRALDGALVNIPDDAEVTVTVRIDRPSENQSAGPKE